MRNLLIISLGLYLLIFSSCSSSPEQFKGIKQEDLTRYVNTLIGTKPWSGKIQLASHELAEGHTYPGVGTPFAMTEWTPQTTTGAIPYWYEEDAKIQGFRATHYPSGAVMAEYGSFTIFPSVGKIVTDAEERASSFNHNTEIAKPHYYSAFLDDTKIKAELTATSRTGFFQFTFPETENASVLLDFYENKGKVEVKPQHKEITGYSLSKGLGSPDNFACYFVVQFDKEFETFQSGTEAQKDNVGCVTFKTSKDEIVKLKVGTSFISIEQARNNLTNEIPHWDFEKVCEQTKSAWNHELNKIQIEGGSDDDKTIFYTSMYHALLLPREFSEQGKYYSPYDGKVHEGVAYTDYSLWDTYRAEHPLLIFLTPEKVNLMIQSLLNSYDEGGWIPKWPNPGYSNVMMGTHADALIADAYVKGLRDYDVDKVWEAMVKNANEPGTGLYAARLGVEDYNYYGFVPGDKYGECVARTLEFAYDDFCLAQMAKAMGNEDAYHEYINRANYYKNVLDPETKNVRGKSSNGCWMDVDDNTISVWAGYTAHSLKVYKWNHTFLAPHDVEGLINFFGGEKEFIGALDTLFNNEYYYVGDEFSMHAPYLYNYAGAPWKTQKLVRQIMNDYFTNEPGGLCGNDDCGQLSSWYIFGAMGFYPVAPGDDYYTIGSPVFEKVSMNLPNGKRFIVTAENMSKENVYIQSATLNGKEFTKSYLFHDQIMRGGQLHFVMGDQPNKEWGSAKNDIPVSYIENYNYLPGPGIRSESTTFEDSLVVELESSVEGAEIYYVFGDGTPTNKSTRYMNPLTITSTKKLRAVSYKDGLEPSKVMVADFYQRPKGRSVKLFTEFSEKYTGGGAQGLIDYQFGNYYFKSKKWQGYEEIDLLAIIDLGTQQTIEKIAGSFLQDRNNWISYPKEVSYYSSNDGETFDLIETIKFDNEIEQSGIPEIRTFSANKSLEARYIKVIAKNQQRNPSWHAQAGEKCWLFVDEILIE